MRSRNGGLNRRFRSFRSGCRGQIVVEYIAVLAMLVVLAAALLFLLKAIGDDGAKTTELVSGRVP